MTANNNRRATRFAIAVTLILLAVSLAIMKNKAEAAEPMQVTQSAVDLVKSNPKVLQRCGGFKRKQGTKGYAGFFFAYTLHFRQCDNGWSHYLNYVVEIVPNGGDCREFREIKEWHINPDVIGYYNLAKKSPDCHNFNYIRVSWPKVVSVHKSWSKARRCLGAKMIAGIGHGFPDEKTGGFKQLCIGFKR